MPRGGGIQTAKLFAQHGVEHLGSICNLAGARFDISFITHQTSVLSQRKEGKNWH